MPTRVVVVDDHPMIRDIVRLACEHDSRIDVVGEADTGEAAIELCRELRPDLLVLDLVLPGIDGFELASRLLEEAPGLKVLVMSGRTDREAVFMARRLGLAGYLPKNVFIERIADSIVAVANGETVYSEDQDRAALEHLADVVSKVRETARVSAALTARELDVLRLLGESLSNKQIARRLDMSTKTAESHISNIYAKLGAKTRVAAVARAIGLGLLESPSAVQRD